MATIRDVARMSGVSISTVSLALNETGRVGADTYQRIWAAAQGKGGGGPGVVYVWPVLPELVGIALDKLHGFTTCSVLAAFP